MADSRLSTLRALWAPKLVKFVFGVVALVASYDSFSSQFRWPKLGDLLGMSGSLLPWWGWLLILQAIFVYALFEYVRMNLALAPAGQTQGFDLAQLAAPIAPRIPDISLLEVAQRVIATFGPPPGDKAGEAKMFREVSLQIADRVKQHKLTVWARNGDRPLEKLTRHDWESGDLILGTSQIVVAGDWGSITYSDVQFESGELDAVWPPEVADDV